MSAIQVNYVLAGPLTGKTINLGSLPYPFREGRLILDRRDTRRDTRP